MGDGGVLEYGIPKEARLSGNTLAASLKMRCDTSGAGYALYWIEEDGQFVVAGDYVTPERKKALDAAGITTTFAEVSKGIKLDASGDGPVATVARTGRPHYVADAANNSSVKRKQYAREFGIQSMAFIPVEGGILEYGNSTDSSTADWGSTMPSCPDMPKDEMDEAFRNGAVYTIFWKREGDNYVSGADYVTPERREALRNKRGDDQTFASKSRHMKLPVSNKGYVATAAESGKAFVIQDASADKKLLRQELAAEFGIGEVHIVPC